MTNKNIIAIIPAAGRGTRLQPFTHYLPKEMMPLGDKPIIHHAIKEIQEAGIEKIILITHRDKGAMADYLFNHANLGLNEKNLLLVYQEEQKGLGDAVLCGMEKIESHVTQVAVVAPDDVMMRRDSDKLQNPSDVGSQPPQQLQQQSSQQAELQNESQTQTQLPSQPQPQPQPLAVERLCNASQADAAAMWVMVEKIKPADSKKYGVLNIIDSQEKNGQTIHQADDLVEKPAPADAPSNMGIIARYILPVEIFSSLQKTNPGAGGEIQLTDGMKNLLPNHKFFGVESNLVRLDTGNVEGLFSANYFYRYNKMPPQ